MIKISKEHLVIRKMKLKDIPLFLEIRNDCRDFLHNNSKFTISEARKWFKKDRPEFFVIEYDKDFIGYIRTSEWNYDNKTVYIGMDIHKKYRGRGYSIRIYHLILSRLLIDHKFKKVYLSVLSCNIIALKLYHKLGFKIDTIDENFIKRFGVNIDNVHMSITLSNYMQNNRGCKVIATYLGNRLERMQKNYPHHLQSKMSALDTLNMLDDIILLKKNINSGWSMDTIIICNIKDRRSHKKELARLLKYQNKITKNGIIKIYIRNNIGGSFGAYNYAYKIHKKDYCYWLFDEDDIVISGKKYFKKLIDKFNQNLNCGFLAVVGISNKPNKNHAHGGVGLSTSKILNKVFIKNSNQLPHDHNKIFNVKDIILNGEIPFTNEIVKLGYDLIYYGSKLEWDIVNNLCEPYYIFKDKLKVFLRKI